MEFDEFDIDLTKVNWERIYKRFLPRVDSERKYMSDREYYYRIQEAICFYCGLRVEFKNWTIDHKQPLSRGGSGKSENKIGCCGGCNQKKGNLTVDEYLSVKHDHKRRKEMMLEISNTKVLHQFKPSGEYTRLSISRLDAELRKQVGSQRSETHAGPVLAAKQTGGG